MKCELIAALLHTPKVLFLDEPTIGLDVVMQKKLRDFVKSYNEQFNATIILTSHYMDDVKELCKRVIIIDHGALLFDGPLDDIVKKFAPNKYLTVHLRNPIDIKEVSHLGKIKEYSHPKLVIEVKRGNTNEVAAHILKSFTVDDINIEEADIEDIIRQVFNP
jgi:ABC-2 type transport system ATP-binding protein